MQSVVISKAPQDLPRRFQPASLYEQRVQKQKACQRQATPADALQTATMGVTLTGNLRIRCWAASLHRFLSMGIKDCCSYIL